jgi:HPt (histidine-containing phosphotransfer) domain-containing protein
MAPPNPSLAELASVLGEDNVRTLVRTFLHGFPVSFRELGRGERRNRHRLVHSMKSNSRLMGAQRLSQRMAEIEARLTADAASDVTPGDLELIAADFDAAATTLRPFAGE